MLDNNICPNCVVKNNQVIEYCRDHEHPMAAVTAYGGGTAYGGPEIADEYVFFKIEMTDTGMNRAGVAHILRKELALPFQEAFYKLNNTPCLIAENLEESRARELVFLLDKAGAKVNLRSS